MATVRFHDICNQCGKHSEEYQSFAWCEECGDDICRECAAKYDEETGWAKCKKCTAETEAA